MTLVSITSTAAASRWNGPAKNWFGNWIFWPWSAARRKASEAARREQEEKDKEALEAARKEAEAARAQAEETARKLQLASSEESIRFALLFEQLQGIAQQMMDIAESLKTAGRQEESAKLRKALSGALHALHEQALME